MELLVNGEAHQVPEGLSVAALLAHLRVGPERVAVEVDRQVVAKADYERHLLDPGARVEIVEFVGGG